MKAPHRARFVERRSYRRRRMVDAARLLPVAGAALICLPLLWGSANSDTAQTTHVMLYLFLVWAGLAALSALISVFLGPPDDNETEADE